MPLTDPVRVSVIIATWGRGAHILPSVQSVLAQHYRAFEVLVIGDKDDPATEAVLAGTPARWINLPERVGSQSGPNNAGIAAARGDIIAYLGHDDLWEPDHLSRIMALFDADAALDFAVSGCILHMPEGVSGDLVSGFFTEDSAKQEHFFPPSSFAHRSSALKRIGGWDKPFEIRAPVDVDLLQRAAKADLRFASTNAVTVHKFAAGHRFLAYLAQDSHEQKAMLAQMGQPDHAQNVAAIVSAAKAQGGFMALPIEDTSQWPIGHWARLNAENKGLRPQLVTLGATPVTIPQTRSHCAQDWHEWPQDGIRWSLRARLPKVLVPVLGSGRAEVRITLHHHDRAALRQVLVSLAGQTQVLRPMSRGFLARRIAPTATGWAADYGLGVTLDPARPVVLTLHLSPDQTPSPDRRGIGLGQIVVRPL